MQPIWFLVLVALSFDAVADAKAGEKKAQLCMLCHKPGNAVAAVPLLEAQPAKYLVAATLAYKSGKRPDPAMQTNVARLSARDIADIADYFASKAPINAASQAVDAAKVAAGESLARELKCAACHQTNYSGVDAVPRLAGQTAGYLSAQLEAFASGRRMHPAAAMPSASGGDTENIAIYLSTLR
jgi:cytochrome c553